jgi:aminoglycoside phosphotransferase (APT) family kinase protein
MDQGRPNMGIRWSPQAFFSVSLDGKATPVSDLMTDMKLRVEEYLQGQDWSHVPVMSDRPFRVAPLARGEYNLNYLLTAGAHRLVFRVNMGSQIDRDDQIQYEFATLQLLAQSGLTPVPYFVDDTRTFFDRGIGIMEYLPGRSLDYTRDLDAAAGLLAAIHQVSVPEDDHHLIREEAPLDLIYRECTHLLETYFRSELADPAIGAFLQEVIAWAAEARAAERFYQEDPWPCIVNTEVNSGNFIVRPSRGTIHLVDWEMPRWGDPSQDLSHFCSPLTTLWKTDFRMTPQDKADFLESYARRIRDPHLRDTLPDRVRLRDPFVYLRGISWSAMGWVAYQTEFAGMRNPDTWKTLKRYLDIGFMRSLFEPFMKPLSR